MSDQVRSVRRRGPRLAGLACARGTQGLELPEWLRSAVDRVVAGVSGSGGTEGGSDLGSLLPIARSLASTLIGAFGYLIIPFWAFYVLKDLANGCSPVFERCAADPPGAMTRWRSWRIVDHTFGRWIRGQILLGARGGRGDFVGLLDPGRAGGPGVPVASRCCSAVVAGVLELVPVIGPIMSMMPDARACRSPRPTRCVPPSRWCVLYLMVQQVENNVLVPKIQGDAVELHPSRRHHWRSSWAAR